MARPAIEITPEIIEKAESLAARGLTQEEIARCLGMGESTLYAKKAKFEEFAEAIKDGGAKGGSIIANALFENAKSGNVTAQIFYLKARLKWQDRHEEDKNIAASHFINAAILEKLKSSS